MNAHAPAVLRRRITATCLEMGAGPFPGLLPHRWRDLGATASAWGAVALGTCARRRLPSAGRREVRRRVRADSVERDLRSLAEHFIGSPSSSELHMPSSAPPRARPRTSLAIDFTGLHCGASKERDHAELLAAMRAASLEDGEQSSSICLDYQAIEAALGHMKKKALGAASTTSALVK